MVLKDALELMLKKNAMMAEFKRQAVSSNWALIVGEIMARRTESVKVVDQTLLITVNSAPMKHQMMMNQHKIVDLVNEYIGEKIVSQVFVQ